jgi:hypothetical protein
LPPRSPEGSKTALPVALGRGEDDVRVVQRFTPLTPEEMTALRQRAAALNPAFEYWKRA